MQRGCAEAQQRPQHKYCQADKAGRYKEFDAVDVKLFPVMKV